MSDQKSSEAPVKSPCVSICALDDEDICIGCYRSGQEITQWGRATEEERRAIMQKVIEREKQSNNYIS